MPLTPDNTGTVDVMCACGTWHMSKVDGHDMTHWREQHLMHIATRCPILRCRNCLETLQSDHPFPGPNGPTPEQHRCGQSWTEKK